MRDRRSGGSALGPDGTAQRADASVRADSSVRADADVGGDDTTRTAERPAPPAGLGARPSGFGITNLPRIARGRGTYLYDVNGKRYVDGSGGPAAFSVGHAHPEINAAIQRQLGEIAYGYRYLFTSAALEELTAMLLQLCGPGYSDVVFTGSGSEAVESALKIALQHFHCRGLPGKRRFIARERSWHGNTLGALSVSGFAERRRAFEGSLLDVGFVSAANAYRPPAGIAASGLAAYYAAELEAKIEALGPDTVAAFVFEPIVGAAGGVVPAPPGYAAAIEAVCRRHDVLLIADEVMCGSGRSGRFRALEHDGVRADLMAIAKGLAGGYIPLAATLCTPAVAAPIISEAGAFQTGHTFTGHTAACAAGLAVQQLIEREQLIERVRVTGARLQAELRAALARYDEVGDVRGRGYFLGVEFVADRATKRPFARERGLSFDIGRRAFDAGLICYPCAGNVDGTNGDTVILAPPYNASDAELEEILSKLTRAVGAALAQR
jgi:adenosylmethionine-8-amino-7-oxononanoate aminotransferase